MCFTAQDECLYRRFEVIECIRQISRRMRLNTQRPGLHSLGHRYIQADDLEKPSHLGGQRPEAPYVREVNVQVTVASRPTDSRVKTSIGLTARKFDVHLSRADFARVVGDDRLTSLEKVSSRETR